MDRAVFRRWHGSSIGITSTGCKEEDGCPLCGRLIPIGMDIDRPSTDSAGDHASITPHDVDKHRSTTTATDLDLVNGTTYIFQVRAVNDNGDGRASNTAEATPARPLPAPVMDDDRSPPRRPRQPARHTVVDAHT